MLRQQRFERSSILLLMSVLCIGAGLFARLGFGRMRHRRFCYCGWVFAAIVILMSPDESWGAVQPMIPTRSGPVMLLSEDRSLVARASKAFEDQRAGRLGEAKRAFLELLTNPAALDERRSWRVDAYISLAHIFALEGREIQAEALYSTVIDHLDISAELDSLKLLQEVLVWRANLRLQHARLEAALEDCERATRIAEVEGSDSGVVLALEVMGRVLWTKGDFESALAILQKALDVVAREGKTKVSVEAEVLLSRALVNRAIGDDGQELVDIRRALELIEPALSPNHLTRVRALERLALADPSHQTRVRVEQTLKELDSRAPDDELARALLLRAKGHVSTSLGEYEEAEKEHAGSLGLLRTTLGDRAPNTLEAIANMARLYGVRDQNVRSARWYSLAVTGYEALFGERPSPRIAMVLAGLARAEHRAGRTNKAIKYQKRALMNVVRPNERENIRAAELYLNLGDMYVAIGEHVLANGAYQRASRAFSQALSGVLSVRVAKASVLGAWDINVRSLLPQLREAMLQEERDVIKYLYPGDSGRRLLLSENYLKSMEFAVAAHMQAAPNHADAMTVALGAVLRRKGRVQELTARTNVALRLKLDADHEEALTRLAALQDEITRLRRADVGHESRSSRRLRSLLAERDQVWRHMVEEVEQNEQAEEPVLVNEIQAALPARSVLLEFVWYRPIGTTMGRFLDEARYAVYVIRPRRVAWVDLGSASMIDDAVRDFRSVLKRGTVHHKREAQWLYDLTMRRILSRYVPQGTTTLFISPDSMLNLVPFEALHDEERHLLERFRVHYLATGRDLLRPWTAFGVASQPPVVIANPTGAGLPGAKQESSILKKMFPVVSSLTGAEATESAVLQHQRPLVFHAATHGLIAGGGGGGTRNSRSVFMDSSILTRSSLQFNTSVQPNDPMLTSGLLLSPEIGEDGMLTAEEMTRWDLRGTQMAVLSACDTGNGVPTHGEGVLGLRRALAVAGSQTQVVSLWAIDDEATFELMKRFYRYLKSGYSRMKALRRAKLFMLHSSEWSHPTNWAGFIASGEWGRISYHTAPDRWRPSAPSGCRPRKSRWPGTDLSILLVISVLRRPRNRWFRV